MGQTQWKRVNTRVVLMVKSTFCTTFEYHFLHMKNIRNLNINLPALVCVPDGPPPQERSIGGMVLYLAPGSLNLQMLIGHSVLLLCSSEQLRFGMNLLGPAPHRALLLVQRVVLRGVAQS